MDRNILIIVNPNAGKGKVQKRIHKIASNFAKQDYLVDIIYTKKNYSAEDIIKDYRGPLKIVICCGGDGTLNDLINAVMKLENKPQISFIPLGTMNDFANTLHLFRHKFFIPNNMKRVNRIKSDIGRFNNKYFNYVAAFGAFTPVSYVTGQKSKKYLGKLAYFIVGMKYLFKIKSYKIKLNVDGEKIEKECIYGSISNSKSIGGFQWFRKRNIFVGDGKFELLLINKPKHKIRYIVIIFDILFKRYQSKNFFFKQGNKIEITSEKGFSWTIDGEFGGRTKDVKISNCKEAVTYIVPK